MTPLTPSAQDMEKAHHSQAQWYDEAFRAFERRLNGKAGSPLHAIRKAAFLHFSSTGFPTARDEEWRFTNISPISRTQFQPACAPRVEAIRAFGEEHSVPSDKRSHRLVFIDGFYVPALSRILDVPEGVFLGGLEEAIGRGIPDVGHHLGQLAPYEGSPFTALSTAFMADGACVIIPEGAMLRDPVHILCLASRSDIPVISQPRHLIVAGRGTEVSVVEEYAGAEGSTYLTNAVTEMVLGPGAVVGHDRVQGESSRAYHVGSTTVRMLGSSVFTSNSVSFGGSIARNNVSIVFAAEGSECTLNGLSISAGSQIIDNHTSIDHASAHCASHELYKAILDGASRGVFNGKIVVRRDAQKTDAKQTNKSLLLSEQATIDTKPQLEIFADDVKCTHGATVGQLDEEQVFYLRSRGVGDSEARDILTFAFAADILGRLRSVSLRGRLEARIRTLMRRVHQTTGE